MTPLHVPDGKPVTIRKYKVRVTDTSRDLFEDYGWIPALSPEGAGRKAKLRFLGTGLIDEATLPRYDALEVDVQEIPQG